MCIYIYFPCIIYHVIYYLYIYYQPINQFQIYLASISNIYFVFYHLCSSLSIYIPTYLLLLLHLSRIQIMARYKPFSFLKAFSLYFRNKKLILKTTEAFLPSYMFSCQADDSEYQEQKPPPPPTKKNHPETKINEAIKQVSKCL